MQYGRAIIRRSNNSKILNMKETPDIDISMLAATTYLDEDVVKNCYDKLFIKVSDIDNKMSSTNNLVTKTKYGLEKS